MIRRKAEEIGAPLQIVEAAECRRQLRQKERYQRAIPETETCDSKNYGTNGGIFEVDDDNASHLTVPYQRENAALAWAAAMQFRECGLFRTTKPPHRDMERVPGGGNRSDETTAGRLLTDEMIRNGIRKAFWPGRMQEVLPRFIIDGAHNEDGIRAFLEAVKAGQKRMPETNILLFCAMKDKAAASEIRMIRDSGLFTKILAAPVSFGRSLSAEELHGLLPEADLYESVPDAVRSVKTILDKNAGIRAYAAGSLYMVGEILACLKEQ